MNRFQLVFLLAGLFASAPSFANCVDRCERTIDPEQCQLWCRATSTPRPTDAGAYCRALFSTNHTAWWTQCGGANVNAPIPPTTPIRPRCPNGPHCH